MSKTKTSKTDHSKTSASNSKSKKPFFNQSNEGFFLQDALTSKEPFFNGTAIQTKLKEPFFHAGSHTIQLQRGREREERTGSILSLYASGYGRNYASDDEEISAVEYIREHRTHDPQDPTETWWPTSIDFREAARRHGGRARGVTSMADMIRIIQRGRNLSEVRLFTHGARQEIQFGSGGSLTLSAISSLPNVSANFAEGGRIIFYACNAGGSSASYDNDFFQALANQLGVTVCGFTRGVRWSLEWDEDRRITSRGLTGRTLPPPPICTNPSATE